MQLHGFSGSQCLKPNSPRSEARSEAVASQNSEASCLEDGAGVSVMNPKMPLVFSSQRRWQPDAGEAQAREAARQQPVWLVEEIGRMRRDSSSAESSW